MIKKVALFFSATDEKTPYKRLLQYETVHNNEVCVLSGCPYRGVFQQVWSTQKKQRNQTIEFSWGLYCLVVLFLLLYVICASIPTEGTVKQGLTTGITEVKNQNLSQVHPWHHTQCVLLIFSRCQISKISYSHVQDSQVTTLWSFLVVRNCFENLSWYFLVKQETLAPVTWTSHPLYMFKLL